MDNIQKFYGKAGVAGSNFQEIFSLNHSHSSFLLSHINIAEVSVQSPGEYADHHPPSHRHDHMLHLNSSCHLQKVKRSIPVIFRR